MSLLEDAIQFAASAHSGQTRKLGNIPYIVHPMEVTTIIASMTDDVTVMAAGLLHDTVEDCGVDPQTIRDRFGDRVAELVAGETEDKRRDRPAGETWLARKTESIAALRNTDDRQMKILWLADKLANLRSFYRVYLKQGDSVWQRLHQKDPKMQGWYYKSVGEYVRDELADTAAYAEYMRIVHAMFDRESV